MQLFDNLMLLVLLATLAAMYLPVGKRPPWLRFLPLLALVFAVIHFNIEGYRWQMVPAYFVLALVLLQVGWRNWKTNPVVKVGRWATIRRFSGTSLLIVVLLSSGLFSWFSKTSS